MLDASTMRHLLTRFAARTTTANAVYETLKHCIVEGSLSSGERLLSDDLASRLGVSRTPVREALRKLEAGGYVSAGSGHGLVVRNYDETDLEEVFLVREQLEGAAARLAAETISRSALDRLGELLD